MPKRWTDEERRAWVAQRACETPKRPEDRSDEAVQRHAEERWRRLSTDAKHAVSTVVLEHTRAWPFEHENVREVAVETITQWALDCPVHRPKMPGISNTEIIAALNKARSRRDKLTVQPKGRPKKPEQINLFEEAA